MNRNNFKEPLPSIISRKDDVLNNEKKDDEIILHHNNPHASEIFSDTNIFIKSGTPNNKEELNVNDNKKTESFTKTAIIRIEYKTRYNDSKNVSSTIANYYL